MDNRTVVPFTALELILEEIHLQRRADLREWQESDEKRGWREHHLNGCAFSDDDGKDLGRLSLVHSSWTSASRRILSRILILSDLNVRSARAVLSVPMLLGSTREVYLSFSRHYDENAEIWDAIASVLARTTVVRAFCLQTASKYPYSIHLCVKRFTGALKQCTRLRTLRLYSDVDHGLGADYRHLKISEHTSLFDTLADLPEFDRLMVRNFFPCYKLIPSLKGGEDEERFPPESFLFREPGSEDPYTRSKKVQESSSLTGRIYGLAELIRSICNTPAELTFCRCVSVGNAMPFASFVFDPTSNKFVVNAARISQKNFELPEDDIRPPSFRYQKWCDRMESLDIASEYVVFKNICPLLSLKFLRASFNTSHGASPDKMREELREFLVLLPPSLEVLIIEIIWENREDFPLLSPEVHDELDELLASVPSGRCPNLKLLAVNLEFISYLFTTTIPTKRLITSCEEREIPLILHGVEAEEECYGVHDRQEIDHLLDFTSHV